LPNPALIYTGSEDIIGQDGVELTLYHLEITNRTAYPNGLFVPAPHLQPCGLNTNSSRTWIYIYDNENNYLYGYCAITSSDELKDLPFALPKGTLPPESVYVILRDRECDNSYTSNLAAITTITDSDGDGMPDAWEQLHGLNPAVNDAGGDLEGDGLSNLGEYLAGTDPNNLDSDGDGYSDGVDPAPLNPAEPGYSGDVDQDGMPDAWELAHGLNPSVNDAGGDLDEDGLLNGEECDMGSDPQNDDTDGDGVKDAQDAFPTNPAEWADSDGDGYGDNSDNCPQVVNKFQADLDGDGKGDACDEDADNDGYISPYLPDGDDCDDLDPSVYPGVGNCVAEGLAPPPGKVKTPPDSDADGWTDAEDNCPGVFQETQADGDNDGVGDACDSCPSFSNPDQKVPVWYKDADSDKFSDGATLSQCAQPVNYYLADSLTALSGDCNDSDGSVNPGATEVPNNGKDDDCDPSTADTLQAYSIVPQMQGYDYNNWLPQDGQTVVVDFTVRRADGSAVPGVGFNLSLAGVVGNPTSRAGKYTNDDGPASADFDPPAFNGNQVTLTARDYGGSITIHASAFFTADDGATPVNLTADFVFPKDSDKDGLADGWERVYGDLLPLGDPDNDGLTNLAEYRGVKWGELIAQGPDSTYNTIAYVPQGQVVHIRTHPYRRDLFVKFSGFDAQNRFALGAAFNEQQIDVHALAESVVLSANLSDLNINVATVQLKEATFGLETGFIVKRAVRDWTFATLGLSSYGDDLEYGAKCTIYKTAFDHFALSAGNFYDRPYRDGTTLKEGGNMREPSDWLPAGNNFLDPMGTVEDRDDDGIRDGGEDKNGNSLLDGDHPIGGATTVWNYNEDLSPFDIDKNGRVEVPLAGVSVDPAYEYTLNQGLKMVITHELGHNTGITIHTQDPTCAMYEQTNNLLRDGHFSPDAAQLIRIHNQ